MADLVGHGDVEKVLPALKKGTQLLKYTQKGKTKLYSFRLSNDESSLIWLSSGKEKKLKLSAVSKLIRDQTPHLHPEKEHISFSLIYDNGNQSLDLICKDKFEAEVWFTGLETLISSERCQRSKIDGWSDGGLSCDDAKDLISNSSSNSSISTTLDITSPDSNLSMSVLPVVSSRSLLCLERSDVINMNGKGASAEVFRASVSSAPSTSSHGSAQDDCDGLGDVYVWGEVICDLYVRAGHDQDVGISHGRTDILLPKPLESSLVLDVHHVACGVRHAALVTKQGEVFTWGEESGGRLGHGAAMDVVHPRLLESLVLSNADFVACGEFHTCAITMTGELYSWGDGTHNIGLLGHGTNVSHWIPKRVSGPLDGLQVSYVTCGTWHTALITSAGQLFTFGDGTFGVLGHGNRESISHPKEVESLMGLKTIAVACGVWHTAAVIEVIVAQSIATVPSGKLFTWGDGDKYRLGHGDKEPRLKPTCVASLIDYNFHKLACGHSMTIGLTTSGRVFTVGSVVYGQLGNPLSDGKFPHLVEDKLLGESVAKVACGSYHIAVLTTKNEVYTWGKGANGRLGHGDIEDRKTPTLVEALKDRSVKQIACGANFTAAVCHHKWMSSSEQSQCSACRQPFGFTRKRHNCYHCGLVHCHSCSSRKAFRAALSPNPRKPYRVCDTCYVKLNNVLEPGGTTKRNGLPNKDRLEKGETKSSKTLLPSNLDLMKNLDIKAAKHVKRSDPLSSISIPQVSSLLQLKDIALIADSDLHQSAPRTVRTSMVQSVNPSRAVSPFSRRSSPPRSATPVPTTSGLSFSKATSVSPKKNNELVNQEVLKLRAQVDNLKHRCEEQELELQKSTKKVQEAVALAAEESAKSKAAKEVIKSLTAQLKDMVERLPEGEYENHRISPVLGNDIASHDINSSSLNGEGRPRKFSNKIPSVTNDAIINENSGQRSLMNADDANKTNTNLHAHRVLTTNETEEITDTRKHTERLSSSTVDNDNESQHPRNGDNIFQAPHSSNLVESEWIEQYEPGVYITLMALPDGTRDLKRVRFSRKRFGEHQAEAWWFQNREKVYGKYNICGSDRVSSATSTQSSHPSEEELMHSPKTW